MFAMDTDCEWFFIINGNLVELHPRIWGVYTDRQIALMSTVQATLSSNDQGKFILMCI